MFVWLTWIGRIIALFVVSGVLGVGFAGIQVWKGDNATVPPRILKKRSIAFGSWFVFCLGGSFFLRTYNFEHQILIRSSHLSYNPGLLLQTSINLGANHFLHPSHLTYSSGLLSRTSILTFKLVVYYIPIWFQAIKGVSAVESGIRNLPLILGLVMVSIIAGVAITLLGYYTPFMILSSLLMATGAGLLSTFTVGTGNEFS